MHRRLSIVPLFLALSLSARALSVQLTDAYPEKARFSPFAPVSLEVEFKGHPSGGEQVSATIWQLGKKAGQCGPVPLTSLTGEQTIACSLPAKDFQGYWVEVELRDGAGHVLGKRQTAIDVSSDWKRFPRYGYLAHYNTAEGAKPGPWIDELNRFHIDGLEFYDFQYRHDQPLAGTIAHPAAEWKDIAGRTIDGSIVRDFIDAAHRHNMTAMAYNASYSAYDDVFTRKQNPLPLQWAVWDTPNGTRTAATVKSLPLQGATGWSTSRLYYMNQNSSAWQHYIFGQMRDLFTVYPFDGWHVDTFGEKGAYAYDGSYVDYIGGFRSYINRASAFLNKRIVFNAVNTYGQDSIARSAADFVYSELWEDHETFASIMETAEQVHLANPRIAFVMAAYVNRHEAKDGPAPAAKQFNPADVLLTDAAIFASGAAHIELGDGDRMLSSEYFPADTRLSVSPQLHNALRHYYDYLTAYENYLRYEVKQAAVEVKVVGYPTSTLAVPNTLWTIAREANGAIVVHLINLLGTEDPHWRDISMTRPEPPAIRNIRVEISGCTEIRSAGWASPDIDGGRFHPIPFIRRHDAKTTWIELAIPDLHDWDTVFLTR